MLWLYYCCDLAFSNQLKPILASSQFKFLYLLFEQASRIIIIYLTKILEYQLDLKLCIIHLSVQQIFQI